MFIKMLLIALAGGLGTLARYGLSGVAQRLSEDLPMIVEIVDEEEKINQFPPELDTMIREGLVTIERITVLIYRHNGDEK